MTTRPDRRATAWRGFWVALLTLLALAETGALRRALIGDTLSETVWWIYGPALAPRWWLLGCTIGALLLWAGLHFMWPPIGWRTLVAFQAVALIVAATGWALTR